jgi:pimeloyl-ACP methyl ester carboxylesterase
MARTRDDGGWQLPLDPAIKTLLTPARDASNEWALLKSIRGPVAIVRGAYSSVLQAETARRMAAVTGNAARLETIAMAGHAIPFEQPGPLAAVVASTGNALSMVPRGL